MPKLKIKNVSTYYEKSGEEGKDVILLHGWGQNTEMMAFIADFLKEHFVVYNIDLPGFGKSGDPNEVWGVEDYTDFLRAFCVRKKINNPIIIGHSFGCRMAVRYARTYPVRKMVLTGAAGIRDERTASWYIKTYSYKLAKKIMPKSVVEKYQNKVGSEDYKNASGIMRRTFVKCVNDDVTELLPFIETETLLVFGDKDEATPVSKGKTMEKLMPNASLVIFENDDHYAYIHEAARFNAVLDAFLRSEY